MTDAGKLFSAAFWLIATLAAYYGARGVYRRTGWWWSAPLMLAPFVLLALVFWLRVDFAAYFAGPRWLALLLGPAMVAFAVPIYRQRALILRYWKTIGVGVFVGSSVAMASSYALARWLALSPQLTHSLLPRSVTSPFAMEIAARTGGVAQLAAVFVIVTGVFGALIAPPLFRWLRLSSAMAKGVSLGMAAHIAGVAKAQEIGDEEAAVAGLTMVLAGVFNVMLAPWIIVWLFGSGV